MLCKGGIDSLFGLISGSRITVVVGGVGYYQETASDEVIRRLLVMR